MNQIVEESLRTAYRNVWQRYRRDDEIEVLTANHARLRQKLVEICATFDHPIKVLDAGCGSGRYFHCLANVELLVALDLSPEMLEAARQPVRHELIDAREIRFICDNIYRATFPSDSFDFIYSLGMFGNGVPISTDLCLRCYDWLSPGGVFFFDVVHQSAFEERRTIRQCVRQRVYPWLPSILKQVLDQRAGRLPSFGLTEEQLKTILCSTRFEDFQISNEDCQSPLWKGSHLEGVARKLNPSGTATGSA